MNTYISIRVLKAENLEEATDKVESGSAGFVEDHTFSDVIIPLTEPLNVSIGEAILNTTRCVMCHEKEICQVCCDICGSGLCGDCYDYLDGEEAIIFEVSRLGSHDYSRLDPEQKKMTYVCDSCIKFVDQK